MRVVGTVCGLVARVVARRAWRRLRGDLAAAYARYCAWVRPQLGAAIVATLVAAEDRRFRRHAGIDAGRLLRALWRGRLRRALSRGTTLEHRLVRIMLRQDGQTFAGLVRSVLLATLVGRVVPKDEVPGVYLTVASFGAGMEGIQRACRRLGFELARLTPLQTAAVLARLRYPEPPVVTPRRAQQIADRAERLLALATPPGDDASGGGLDAEDDRAPRPAEELEDARPEVLPMERVSRPLALVFEDAGRSRLDRARTEVEREAAAGADVGHPVRPPAAVPEVERPPRAARDEP
jgi:penicillin-binding protein 1C